MPALEEARIDMGRPRRLENATATPTVEYSADRSFCTRRSDSLTPVRLLRNLLSLRKSRFMSCPISKTSDGLFPSLARDDTTYQET